MDAVVDNTSWLKKLNQRLKGTGDSEPEQTKIRLVIALILVAVFCIPWGDDESFADILQSTPNIIILTASTIAVLIFLAIIRNFRSQLVNALAHCFTGTTQQCEDYLKLDMHIGVTGWVCDERRGHDLQAALPAIPFERLMVETDAPYLLPRTITPRPKSRRNEPAMLIWIVDKIASLTQTEPEEIAAASTGNAVRFFGLPASQ